LQRRAGAAIPIPAGVSFEEASTIPVQGLSALAMLKYAAKLRPDQTILVQAAAGGVGVYLVQLAKLFGVKTVVALAGTEEKLKLARELGADIAINYRESDWANKVFEATAGQGADVVLEAASGKIGEESFKLLAPFGTMVVYGARNIHDTFGPERIQQLIYKNQTLTGFNIPSLRGEQIAACVPELLRWIAGGNLRLVVGRSFKLEQAREAFQALASRQTIGKVVLVP
jgi:NADPH2:quinone reductase